MKVMKAASPVEVSPAVPEMSWTALSRSISASTSKLGTPSPPPWKGPPKLAAKEPSLSPPSAARSTLTSKTPLSTGSCSVEKVASRTSVGSSSPSVVAAARGDGDGRGQGESERDAAACESDSSVRQPSASILRPDELEALPGLLREEPRASTVLHGMRRRPRGRAALRTAPGKPSHRPRSAATRRSCSPTSPATRPPPSAWTTRPSRPWSTARCAASGDEIERFGGTIDKFIGDNVMGVFGAPVAHEDDPERAVRAGLGHAGGDGGDQPRVRGARWASRSRCASASTRAR